MNKTAVSGFSTAVEAYVRGRPDYPSEAIEFVARALRLSGGRTILDVGAGTGKFAKLLIPSGARLIPVEPIQEMRNRLHADLPGLAAVGGTAERLPFADRSADGIVVAQAFHWFDGSRALAEFSRVLRDDGMLALVWNIRDERVEWMQKLSAIMDAPQNGTPSYRDGRWQRAFETSHFEPLQRHVFQHVQRGDADMVTDRVASVSYIAALPDADRRAVLDEVRQLLATSPETRGKTTFEIPYQTFVYTTKARAD